MDRNALEHMIRCIDQRFGNLNGSASHDAASNLDEQEQGRHANSHGSSRENSCEGKSGIPIVYIFDAVPDRLLQVGVTLNLQSSLQECKQRNPYGELAYYAKVDVPATGMWIVEDFLRLVLDGYRKPNSRPALYDMSVDDAKVLVEHVESTFDMKRPRGGCVNPSGATGTHLRYHMCDVATQTYGGEDMVVPSTMNTERRETFDRFIAECCYVSGDGEVSNVDIAGRYRLWSRKPEKEAYHALLDYLATRFRRMRLKIQNSENVINGYRGLTLKPMNYKLSAAPTDAELFVVQSDSCLLTPGGKELTHDLVSAFSRWKASTSREPSVDDGAELKKFLRTCPYVIPALVWTISGNGQGYYGISLRRDYHARKTSSTAKKIEKCRSETNEVLDSWTSIAKAASAEGLPAVRLSRIIQAGLTCGDHYFRVAAS